MLTRPYNTGDDLPKCPAPNSVSLGKNVLPCVDSSGNSITCPTGYTFTGTWTGIDQCTCVTTMFGGETENATASAMDIPPSDGFVDCLVFNSKGETVSKDSLQSGQEEIEQLVSVALNPSVFVSFILMFVLMVWMR